MRRFAFAIVVGLLTFSVSGVSSLTVDEPCTGYELPGKDDGACPPTCATCGCCAQAAEPVLIGISIAPHAPVIELVAVLSPSPNTDPRDILHVPKLALA